ncbi:MAG TPA: hypothetical protein VFA32_21195 [Dehalococcoidia bacterium]|jgi:hypothetical protein|nr:hypothetical protein [Dehalococcoidia bacterium]
MVNRPDGPTVDIASLNEQLSQLSRIEDRLNRRLRNRDFRRQLFDEPVQTPQ